MKILLLTTHLNIGGISVYTVNLAKGIKDNGHDVVVASGGGGMVIELEKYGIKHIFIDIKTKSEFGFKVWKAVPHLIRIIKNNKIQLIHSQTRVAQVLAKMACGMSGVPFLSTAHGFYRYKKFFRKAFPCWGTKIIAISKSVRKHLTDDFKIDGEKISLVYNGIDLEPYKLAVPDRSGNISGLTDIVGESKVIGSIGRLSSVKGYKYLIKAFKNISLRKPEYKLVLIGNGPERENLKVLSERLGIKEKVVFVSQTEKISEVLPIIDIFCLPSLHEGLGLSLMEAMASGRVCVASSAGGLKELIDDGENGVLVEPGDEKDLEKGIMKCIEDEPFSKKCSSKAREKALRCFSVEESVKKTVQVYQEILQ